MSSRSAMASEPPNRYTPVADESIEQLGIGADGTVGLLMKDTETNVLKAQTKVLEAFNEDMSGTTTFSFDDAGMYAAVLVSSFGGVRYDISANQQGFAYPFFMMLLCVPLFLVQLSAIVALRLDIEVEKRFFDEAEKNSLSLLRVKFLMVIILYLMNFRLILNSIRALLLVLNPLTWLEVRNYWPRLSSNTCTRWMERAGSSVLWAVLAMVMRLAVGYCVCVDSVSIILNSATASDTIFNSLAITFIIDLSKCWWDFCASIFHFSNLDDFTFEIANIKNVWTEAGEIHPKKAEKLSCVGCIRRLIHWTSFRNLTGNRSFLCRSNAYHKAELLVAFVILYFMYRRQLYLVLYAVETNVVPVARDICAQWRLSVGHSLASWAYHLVEGLMPINVAQELHELAEIALDGHCSSHSEYHPMKLGDEVRLQREYPVVVFLFEMLFIMLLVMPQIGFMLMHCFCRKSSADLLLDEDEQQGQDIAALQKKQEENDEKFRQQAEMLEKLTAELKKLQQSKGEH